MKILFILLAVYSLCLAKPKIVNYKDDIFVVHQSCAMSDLFIEIYRVEELAANNETFEILIENSVSCKSPYDSKSKIQWKDIPDEKNIPREAIFNKEMKFKLRECSVSEYLNYGEKSKFICHSTKISTDKDLIKIISNSNFWGGMENKEVPND